MLPPESADLKQLGLKGKEMSRLGFFGGEECRFGDIKL